MSVNSTAVTYGPNIQSGDSISFSTLRRVFTKTKPRSSFSSSEELVPSGDSGPIRASDLLRITTENFDTDPGTEDISSIDYTSPHVPDCTENQNISESTNWKTSQFVGSVKYYYFQQSGTDNNGLSYFVNSPAIDISSFSWNSNLPKSIRKWFFIDGVIGSNRSSHECVRLTTETSNLSMIVSGQIYGAGGYGERKILANPAVPEETSTIFLPEKGGNSFVFNFQGGKNIYINMLLGSKVYAGGGGGPKGGDGGIGGQGGASYLNWGLVPNCGPTATSGNSVPGNGGGTGGPGGTGRGYNNDDTTGSIAGADGFSRGGGTVTQPAPCGWTLTSGASGGSGLGGKGGKGGEWGAPGDPSTVGRSGGRGTDGNDGGGYVADCGPCAPPPTGCKSCGAASGGAGGTGQPGSAASSNVGDGGFFMVNSALFTNLKIFNNGGNVKGGIRTIIPTDPDYSSYFP